jgi:phosphonate transport system ATP-binding protein
VVFDGTPSELTAEAVHEIYGADQHGAGIDETMTSTSINIAHQDNELRKIPSAGLRPLAAAEA